MERGPLMGRLRFVRFNRAGEQFLGQSRGGRIGKNDSDLFPPEEAERFTATDREVLAGGSGVEISEGPIETAAKGLRYLQTKKIPILDEAGRPAYGPRAVQYVGIVDEKKREAASRLDDLFTAEA